MSRFRATVSLVLLATGLVLAQDWPQFLGPDRDGHYAGPALDTDWDVGGPPEVWRRPVGAGFAGPVVVDGQLILFHRIDDREVVEAIDASTGEVVQRIEIGTDPNALFVRERA